MEYEATERPDWLLKGDRIDETLFAREYLLTRALISYQGHFYGIQGCIRSEEKLRQEIYRRIQPHIRTALSKKVTSLLETIRMECNQDEFPVREKVIHLANGTFHLEKGYSTDFDICRHRLPVYYDENCGYPEAWMDFLTELLEPEDIDTLQEYMGYCLLPITVGQKMLILTGSGGEGKSRIGVVMKAIFGDALGVGSLSKVEMNQFARADLEGLLVFVDDDLKMEALSQTNYLKTIITAETDMDLERKGKQSYQGRLYARLLAFGNSNLQALHDRSHGFFRRQILITTKPRRADRVDDPFLGQKLIREKHKIFMWALAGLYRLHAQNYQFTISRQTQNNMARAVAQSDNVISFLKSRGYIVLDRDSSASIRQLYRCYCQWCQDNSLPALSSRSFGESLQIRGTPLGLRYTTNVPTPQGRHVRGYRGIRLAWEEA